MPDRYDETSTLHLEVALDSPFGRAIDAETHFHRLIRAVARSVTAPDSDPLEWKLTRAESNGVVSLHVAPARGDRVAGEPDDDTPARVVEAVATGLMTLERDAVRPIYFTDDALEHARDLALLRPELGTVGVRNGTVGSEITERSAENVSQLLAPTYEEYGSVEGKVETVNLHVANRFFNVYEPLDHRRIRCQVGQRIAVDDIREALDRRVSVSGTISYRDVGVAVSVLAERITVFPDEQRLPSVAQMRGILG